MTAGYLQFPEWFPRNEVGGVAIADWREWEAGIGVFMVENGPGQNRGFFASDAISMPGRGEG